MGALLLTWDELAATCGGHWLVAPAGAGGVTAVNLNSQTVQPGELFLAYKGEKHDGHSFIADALAHGAAGVLVHRAPDAAALGALQANAIPCLQVPDTLAAYLALGRRHRERFAGLAVVAVTGSSGKTSTKEMLAAVARARYGADAVLATEGNTNNLVGVPRNLLRLTAAHRAAVLECGTNAPGEIQRLVDTVRPTASVLTSVGPVHLEGLGSIDGVAREKAAIFATLKAAGLAVLPAPLAAHREIRPLLPKRVLTVGDGDDATVRIRYLAGDWDGSRFTVRRADNRETTVAWSLLGRHQALNAGLAFAVGGEWGLADADIAAALAACQLPGMRMKVSLAGDVRWVNDAYNANPASMAALLDWLASIPGAADANLIVCLGDMLELGPTEHDLHLDVLRHARATIPQATLMPIGTRMSRASAELGLTAWPTVAAARAVLHAQLQPGRTVVLKASRGMALEGLL